MPVAESFSVLVSDSADTRLGPIGRVGVPLSEDDVTDRSRDLPHDCHERWKRAQQLFAEFIAAGGSLDTPLHGAEDGLGESERRLVESIPALAELTDDEIALFAVWVQDQNALSLPQEIALRFEKMVAAEGLRAMRERVRQALALGELPPLPDFSDEEMGEEPSDW